MFLAKLAFRNLWRRKFRTVITVFALGLCFGMLLFVLHMKKGVEVQLADTGIRMEAGHVIIQEKEYGTDKSIEKNLDNLLL